MANIRGQKLGFLCGTAILGAMIAPVPAFAQGAAASTAQADDGVGLEEIVVTAQKREQNLQDVPIAITALTKEALQANRITSVGDLSGLAPGFQVRAAVGGVNLPAFTVRGVVSYGVAPGSDKEVSIYLDGVYISSPRASIFTLPDIARLELLRGPQGTLFGRNATAGAISVTTRDPTGDPHIKATASAGNYGHYGMRLSADFPQVGPFSAYASYVHEYTRGDIRNLGAGAVFDRSNSPDNPGISVSPQYLGTTNQTSYFGALKFQPFDDFKVVYKIDHSVDHGTPDGQALVGYDPLAPIATLPYYGNLLAALLNDPANANVVIDSNARRPSSVSNSYDATRNQKVTGHSVNATWRVSDAVTIKNTFGMRKSSVFVPEGIDGLSAVKFTAGAVVPYAQFAILGGLFSNPAFITSSPAAQGAAIANALLGVPALAARFAPLVGQPFVGLGVSGTGYSKQWSDELQVTYSTPLVDVTAGAVWFKGKDKSGSLQNLDNTLQFRVVPGGVIPIGNENINFNNQESIAAYIQGELHLNEKLTVIGGARITQDKKDGITLTGVTPALAAPIVFNYKKTKPNYQIGVNYKPTNDILLFAKFSTAFVSGGKVSGVAFDPETVTSYEGGIKADLLDRRLRVNLALFDAVYKNYQVVLTGSYFPLDPTLRNIPAFIVSQGGPVKARGFELEITAAPVRGITLGASAGYTRTKFTTVSPLLLAANNGTYSPTLRPDWSGSIWAQYETAPLFDDTTFVIRADGNWRSSLRLDANNARTTRVYDAVGTVPGNMIVNGHASLRNLNIGQIKSEVSIWVKNLTDDKKPIFATQANGILASASFERARTFGLDLTIEF
jgi:iron complex outermembrane receptor protein